MKKGRLSPAEEQIRTARYCLTEEPVTGSQLALVPGPLAVYMRLAARAQELHMALVPAEPPDQMLA